LASSPFVKWHFSERTDPLTSISMMAPGSLILPWTR
jgi:hypothetical protein